MMVSTASAFLFLVALTLGSSDRDSWKRAVAEDWDTVNKTEAFEGWKSAFSKHYADSVEESHAFLTFVANWKLITDFNAAGNSFTLRLNQFGDLTGDAFRVHVHGHSGSCLTAQSARTLRAVPESAPKGTVPAAIDWTDHNGSSFVTAVKNQGSCGSCWAFSTTGAIESRAAIASGHSGEEMVSLSEQQLVDCSGSFGNKGCSGGLMDDAFEYIEDAGGLCSETEYPYTAKDGNCTAERCTTRYDAIAAHHDVAASSYSSMEEAVASGPVSVAIEADQLWFQFYHSGVFERNCGTKLDHGVLVVGYGEMDGQKYWKVKNSWGDSWGLNGYILLCKECGKNGDDGQCGLLMQPSYPVMK